MTPLIEDIVVKGPQHNKKSDGPPVTTTWNDERMIRNQSFRASVKEIVKLSENADVVKVNLVGKPGTGKTTLAKAIAHEVHTQAKRPFAVKIFTKDDLMDFENVLKELKPTNYIMIFDDVSFIAAKNSKKQIEQVKQAFTEIRHLEGGRDVKIVSIFNFHYNLALDKYLRQSEFQYYTSMGSSDIDNTIALVGPKFVRRIDQFIKVWNQAYTKDRFTYVLGHKKKGKENTFTYTFRKPFIPLLFWNSQNLRHVVSPTREWIQPICPICNHAEGRIQSKVNVDVFCEQLEAQFKKPTVKAVLKQLLKDVGLDTYSADVIRCRRIMDRSLSVNELSLTDLAVHYGLTQATRTKTRGKQVIKL
jgi:ABC-type dipeptide/oligopeptide/nickel transport system ATPase component